MALVDWASYRLRCSFMPGNTPREVALAEVERLGGGVDLGYGRYGYTSGVQVLSTGTVMFNDDRPELWVTVSLPSTALARLGVDVVDFFADVIGRGGEFRRVDVAMDTDKITPYQARDWWDSGELVTRAQKGKWIESGRGGSGGATLYIGKGEETGTKAPKRLVRIYDWYAAHGRPEGVGRDEVLTRIEVQFLHEYATEVGLTIAHGYVTRQGEACSLEGMVAQTLDFRTRPDGDTNVSRWRRMAWWSALLKGLALGKVDFKREKVEETLERTVAWVTKAVAPTLAKLWVAAGHLGWINTLLETGSKRLTPEQVYQALCWGDSDGVSGLGFLPAGA